MPSNLPDSPPAAPVIPVGLGTKAGLLMTAVLGVVAVLAAISNGDHSDETIAGLAGSVWVLSVTIGGRMAQAAAALRAAAPYIESVGHGLRGVDRP
jgi:hypothetical protein